MVPNCIQLIETDVSIFRQIALLLDKYDGFILRVFCLIQLDMLECWKVIDSLCLPTYVYLCS